MMNCILWLWMKALGANPYGVVLGMIVGVIVSAFLAQYLLARTLNIVWLAAVAIVAAALGAYIMALAGGFFPYWVARLLSRFS